ncbi:MAG: DUF1684 domain-containing protein [Cyclobacteriaceae bacterium]|nr:DUF1684 domain-containing protein [Cyclobacteriaceae bacterium]
MKIKNILPVTLVVLIISVLLYSLSGSGEDEAAYIASIKTEREEKNTFLKTSEESPFKDSLDTFQGLSYFDIDSRYRVKAKLEPVKNKKVVLLGTSDGKENRYLEFAHAVFEIEGAEQRLLILEVMDMGPVRGTLFLAFADETSARETYGAGRYLDVKKVPGATSIELDFNKAYNPYCAYNDQYSCPLPPPENILRVAIKAGEKNYH